MQESVQKGTDTNFQSLTQPASRARMTLALIIIAGFLDVIDFSIVQVALPTIRTELVVSLAESQWIIGAYGLTLADSLCSTAEQETTIGQKKCSSFESSCLQSPPFQGDLPHSLPPLFFSKRFKA